MASTFTIIQAGKQEIVTAYIDDSYLSGMWVNCGIYNVQILGSTPSGEIPINWFQYITIEWHDNEELIKYWWSNNADDQIVLHINPNTSNIDSCYLDDTSSENYPNGIISCQNPSPSGFARTVGFTLKSTDESKVVINPSKNTFQYDVSG